jgi:hypothetical protein
MKTKEMINSKFRILSGGCSSFVHCLPGMHPGFNPQHSKVNEWMNKKTTIQNSDYHHKKDKEWYRKYAGECNDNVVIFKLYGSFYECSFNYAGLYFKHMQNMRIWIKVLWILKKISEEYSEVLAEGNNGHICQ